ncbi:MAG: amidohydrolase [Chloroflexi bacterium]|nr:amidohydrolase [Chloroflexota bacterium]
MKIIDFHTHIFPPEIRDQREDYLNKDFVFASLYTSPKARLATAEDLIAAMDEAGIATSVALNLNWLSHELCVRTNDYIMEAVSRHPGRLVGFGMVLPAAGEAGLRELERCIKGGLKGIGEVRPSSSMFEGEAASALDGLAAMARQHGMVVLTHSSEPVGHRYAGKGKVGPALLCRLISTYPGLKIVCAHWGGGLPFYEFMPEVSSTLNNTYYDTAASTLLYKMDVFEYAAAFLPRNKVLFGSDFPLISPKKFIQRIKALNLPVEKEESLLWQNAAGVLSLESGV